MKEFEITCCIRSSNGRSTHENITHIGNNVSGWMLTAEAAIRSIEQSRSGFYAVQRPSGQISFIGVVRQKRKRPHLRAHVDGDWNDHLLELPACTKCRLIK